MANLKLLFVDPDQAWLSDTKKIFQDKSYDVEIAVTGKDAQVILSKNHFFATVLCLDTKEHSGIQVLNFIKSTHPSMKVILTLKDNSESFPNYDEARKEFLKLGICEVLKSPYSALDINALIEGEQNYAHYLNKIQRKEGQSEEETVEANEKDFTMVRIDEFISGQAVLFDTYVKLSSGRFVKILHAGDTFSKERIEKYKNEKKVEHLHFKTEDRKKYIQFCSHLLNSMIGNESISIGAKVAMAKNMTEKFVEEIYATGVKPQLFEKGKEIADQTYNMIKKEKSLYKLLRQFQEFDPSTYSHAFLLSMFANMLIKQFQWDSPVTSQTVAFSCMIHDLGKLKLPPNIALMKVTDMNAAELAEYQKHPEYGVELLKDIPTVKDSIKQIVLQHHEFCDGSGYPLKLNHKNIFTMAKVVALANDFCDKMVEKKQKPTETLKDFVKDPNNFKKYGPDVLENFLKVFIDPSKIASSR